MLPPGTHSSNRLFEWVAAIMMLLIGLTLALPGEVISDPINLMTKRGIVNEEGLTFFFTSVGFFRMAALYANGAIAKLGPRVRALGSAIGAFIWLEMATISIFAGLGTHKVTIAAAVYGALTIGEVLSWYRATYDAGRCT